ncbi:hypothetical protein [Shewanella psychromarinicola]
MVIFAKSVAAATFGQLFSQHKIKNII